MRRFAEQRVLAIDPANRGFGYAVLEGPQSLLDWGVTGTRTTTTGDLAQHAETLIDTYEPDMIVVEDYGLNIARQRRRAQAFLRVLARHAAKRHLRVCAFARATVRKSFADARARNKDQVALLLATRYPALLPWLPKVRKIWMPEEYRMNIFDAVALGVTFFGSRKPKPRAANVGRAPAITGQNKIPPWLKKNEHPTTSPRP